jgi:hypothetical protein
MSNAAVIIVIIVAVIVVAALAVAGLQIARKKQTERLRAQYGPEYDRVVKGSDNPREAEAELREREKRHKKLDLRPLEPKQKADFERRWTELQGDFVDDPSGAVRGADQLVVEVMSARGYPVDDFDQRADDLSVSHPRVTQHYREARKVAKSNEDGSADTEDLRKAVTSYRELVKALLNDGDSDGDSSDRSTDKDRHAHSANGAAPTGTRTDRPDTGRSDMGKGDSDTGRITAPAGSNGQVHDGREAVRTPTRDAAEHETATHETPARETERKNN